MNLRQQKKHLKTRIRNLESDNKLMKDIINNYPHMREMYDLYNRPLNVTTTHMHFEEYRCKRHLRPDDRDNSGILMLYERDLTNEILRQVEREVRFHVDMEGNYPTIEARIFIGRKDT